MKPTKTKKKTNSGGSKVGTVPAMNASDSEVDALIKQFGQAHAQHTAALKSCLSGTRMAVVTAVRAGDICRELKGNLAHGEWTEFVTSKLKNSLRQIQRYMRISRHAAELDQTSPGWRDTYSMTELMEVLADRKDEGEELTESDMSSHEAEPSRPIGRLQTSLSGSRVTSPSRSGKKELSGTEPLEPEAESVAAVVTKLSETVGELKVRVQSISTKELKASRSEIESAKSELGALLKEIDARLALRAKSVANQKKNNDKPVPPRNTQVEEQSKPITKPRILHPLDFF
jgi:hypothetical protein